MAEIEYQNSHTFNEHLYLRYCLWKNGLMAELTLVPGLFKVIKFIIIFNLNLIIIIINY